MQEPLADGDGDEDCELGSGDGDGVDAGGSADGAAKADPDADGVRDAVPLGPVRPDRSEAPGCRTIEPAGRWLAGADPPSGSVGSDAAALSCGATVSVTPDMSMTAMAMETTAMIGGRTSTGCPRIAAALLRAVVRTRSAAIATAMATAGRSGPWPMIALLRTRIRAARRCAGVRPGSR